MTQTVLVTGATGLLGREVLRVFQREISWNAVGQGLTRATPPAILKADLQNANEIEKLLDDVK